MIEDEEDICEAVVSYLVLEGFNVHGVSNTIQADKILAQQKVDIIILDLGLPDKDGLEWLKETKVMLNIGLIIATARAEVSDKLKGLSIGADAYLIKPVVYAYSHEDEHRFACKMNT
jgi:two-component system response regulator PhoP